MREVSRLTRWVGFSLLMKISRWGIFWAYYWWFGCLIRRKLCAQQNFPATSHALLRIHFNHTVAAQLVRREVAPHDVRIGIGFVDHHSSFSRKTNYRHYAAPHVSSRGCIKNGDL